MEDYLSSCYNYYYYYWQLAPDSHLYFSNSDRNIKICQERAICCSHCMGNKLQNSSDLCLYN